MLKQTIPSGPLHPNEIVRPREAEKYFGYRHSQLAEKVKVGEIPTPIKLSDSGRSVGWTGQQILEWQRARMAAAKGEQ
jgi:predicted DNA-binding transcriptional regulator AlpA